MAVKKESKEKPAAAAAPGDKASEVAPAEINVDDFGRLVAGMSRLLVGFGQLKPLRDAGMGLGEWVALGMLARQQGVSTKLLSRNLGVSVQRGAQITSSLVQGGLVSVGPSAEVGKAAGGKTVRMIKVTDSGKIKLDAVNMELKTMLGASLGAVSLTSALKRMKPLGRLLRAAQPEKANNKKKGKKAKKAGEATEAQAAPAQA